MATYTWVQSGGTFYPSGTITTGDSIIIPAGSTLTVPASQVLNKNTISVSGPATTVSYAGVTANNDTVSVSGSGVTWNIGTGSTITGDIVTFDTSDVLSMTSSTLNAGTLTFGTADVIGFTSGTIETSRLILANNDTLTFTGTAAGMMVIDPNGGGPANATQIVESGSNDLLTISSLGTVISNGFVWIENGTTAALDIEQNGTVGGLYYTQGPLLVTGGTLAINAGTMSAGTISNPDNGVFANAGFLLDWGGSRSSLVTITGSMDSAGGMMEILGTGTSGAANGATLELATKTSGSQAIVFGDSHGKLQIDAAAILANQGTTTVLSNTDARMLAFQPGDTIDLAGLAPAPGYSLTYKYGTGTTYGTGVLELFNTGTAGSTLIGLLRFAGNNFVTGTGTLTNAGSFTGNGNFVLASDGAGGTQITLQTGTSGSTTIDGTVAVWSAGTGGDWTANPSLWTGGEGTGGLPGTDQTAEFTMTAAEATAIQQGSFPQYVVTVNSAVTAGSVVFADPLGTLDIAAPMVLNALGSLSGGGSFQQTQGTVDILSGGTLTATSYYQIGDTLLVQSGGTMVLSGSLPFTAPLGLSGLDVEHQGTIAGGTVRSSGDILIGEKNDGQLAVTSGSTVTDTFTNIGGATFANPDGGVAALDIAGPNTNWTDAGGDSTTPYSGAMLVGGGYPGMNSSFQVNVGNGGTGALWVDQGATLTDASYAMFGLTPTSIGFGTISNGAVWQVNTGGTLPGSIVLGTTTLSSKPPPLLTVGALGSGYLTIDNRGTVTLGTTVSGSGWAMAIGQGSSSNPAAFGMVVVDGQGSVLNTNGGPLIIGAHGTGILNVTNGGSVSVGNVATATASGVTLGGQSGASGTLWVAGTINNGTLVSSVFSVGSSNLIAGGNGTASGFVNVGAGGTLSVAAGFITLGNGTGNGTLDVFGGTVLGSVLQQNGSNPSFGTPITIGGNTLVGNGGTSVWVNGVVALSQEGTLSAGFNLNSGTASIGTGGTLALDNTGIVNLFGGSTLDLMGGGTTDSGALLQVGTSGAGGQIFIGSSGLSPALLSVGFNAAVEAGTIAIGSNGTLTVSGGSVEAIQLSAAASGSPSISIGSGGSVALTDSGALVASLAINSGTASINSGGTLSIDQFGTATIGGAATLAIWGPGVLQFTSAEIGTSAYALSIGDPNGIGVVTMQNVGALINTAGGDISVGQSAAGGGGYAGTLSVGSGATVSTGGGLAVVGNIGAGTLSVGGGNALFNAGTGNIEVGLGNSGTLAIQQGGTVAAGNIYLSGVPAAPSEGGSGTLSMSGGLLLATSLQSVQDQSAPWASSINIANGTVQLTSPGTLASTFVVDNGNAQINGGGTVALDSTGLVTIGGGGSLTVMGSGASQALLQIAPGGAPGTRLTLGDANGNGSMLVEYNGATVNTGGNGISVGQSGTGSASFGGTLTVTSSGTMDVGGVSVIGNFGYGTLVVGGTGPSALFNDQTGTLVVGVNNAGLVAVQSAGTLLASAIDLDGGAGISPGTGQGTLSVGSGGLVRATELSADYNPNQNPWIDINGGSVALAAAGTLAAAGLDLDGGSAQINNGGTLSLDNTGVAVIGGDATLHLDAGVLRFGTGYTGSGYRLAIGDPSGGGDVTLLGSASIDGGGPISVGQFNWGTLSIGQNSTVTASTAMSVAPWAAVVGNSGAGMLNLGGAWGSGALFSTQGALVVGLNNDGTLLVQQGGTVSVGGELDVGGSPLAGSSDGTGWVTIDGGGTVGDANLMVSGSIVVGASTLSGTNGIVVQNGGSLDALETAWLGYGTSASGTLSLASSGQAQLGGLSLWMGSVVTLDSTGELLLGNGAPIGSGQVGIGSNATLDGAGTVSALSGIVDDGVIAAAAPPVAIPGVDYVLTIGGPVSGTGLLDVGSDSTLDLSAVASSDTIAFGGTADVLALQSPASVAATIDNFWVGSTIDLLTVADNDVTWSWNQVDPSGGTLTVLQDAAPVSTLSVSGWHDATTGFTLLNDQHGGTDVVANDIPCFAAGTRIATTRGEVAVEALAVGDEVRLAGGGSAPVVWLGHRNVACARHPRAQDIMPVRVSAHAFGAGQPACDLMLSPDHGVFIDGVLIPVRYLLNGATIVQEPAERVSYWHVELKSHDVLLAEGLPCESYLDTGNRGAFANGDGAVMAHPDFALRVWERASCARLVTGGAELEAARSYLLDRARQLGFRLTDEPDLHVVVNGRTLRGEVAGGGVHRFALPGDAAAVVIASRAAAPQETHDAHPDGRRLGVMLQRIRFSQPGRACEVGLAALPDGDGFHALEQDGGQCWRWTDGEARLRVPAGFAADAALTLELEVAASMPAWVAPVRGAGGDQRAA